MLACRISRRSRRAFSGRVSPRTGLRTGSGRRDQDFPRDANGVRSSPDTRGKAARVPAEGIHTDACPPRGLPPYPALRPAGQRNAKGQHRPHPRVAWTSTTRTGSAGTNGACTSHLTRTMPLLRRSHARHRDLPARTKTNVARPTSGTGRMTQHPSPFTHSDRQRHAALAQTSCAELRTRANLAAKLAIWRTLNATRRAMQPANIAHQDATRSAETKALLTACTQSP